VERMQGYFPDDPDATRYPDMLPLIRLRVDTTGVPNMGNPNRFGQEFHGRVANRDPIVYHQTKKQDQRKVKADQPKLSIDEDPEIASLSLSERLSRVRVGNLVHEYLAAQELQLLGESGMSDAVQTFVDKDDSHSIEHYVTKALDKMISSVDATEALDESEVADTLTRLKEQHEAEYEAEQNARRTARSKGKKKDPGPAEDRDSMDGDALEDAMSVDEEAPPRTKKSAAPAKKATKSSTTRKPPAKKAPARPKGKAKKLFDDSDEVEEDQLDDIQEDPEDIEESPPPQPKKKSRADVLSSKPPAKKAPAKKGGTQTTLSIGSSRTTSRAAASKAKNKIQAIELSD